MFNVHVWYLGSGNSLTALVPSELASEIPGLRRERFIAHDFDVSSQMLLLWRLTASGRKAQPGPPSDRLLDQSVTQIASHCSHNVLEGHTLWDNINDSLASTAQDRSGPPLQSVQDRLQRPS